MRDLSDEQNEAVDCVMQWFYKGGKQYLNVGGVAGCVLADTKIRVKKKSNNNVHKIVVINPEPEKSPME